MRLSITVILVLMACVCDAAIEAYQFESAQMEADYNRLINELRCLVCQNQNLAGSNADLAKDLRKQTHELLMQGNTADQVVEYMVSRYGDFVLYRPQLQANTLLLWLGPFVLLIVALALLIGRIRSNQSLASPHSDTIKRAKKLLSKSQDQL